MEKIKALCRCERECESKREDELVIVTSSDQVNSFTTRLFFAFNATVYVRDN